MCTTSQFDEPQWFETGPADRTALAAPKLATGTILVAEGNPAWRQTTSRHLAELGYRTFEAENTGAALRLLDDARIDLLLIDAATSGRWSTAALARTARERYPALKILLTAGLPDFKRAPFADLDCSVAFLGRSYRKDDLATALHDALDD